MVKITFNGVEVEVEEGLTILEASRAASVEIPHLCYLKELNEIGACRVCSVEVEGEDKLIPACNTKVRDGLVIYTNSPKVRTAIRNNLSLIMSQHNGNCNTCDRNGNCKLQKLAKDFNIVSNPYPEDLPSEKECEWNMEAPLIRDSSKCIKCMRCIQVCDKVQDLQVWDLVGTGGRSHVGLAEGKDIKKVNCSSCGQCVTHCPVGALKERDDVMKVLDAIADPEITTVVQIAPAVRTSWGEDAGVAPDKATVNRLAGALKAIGIDYVFDSCYTADLTIMEEANEFLERFKEGDLAQYPMFTSCCPAWVRYCKTKYPELVKQLSTSKSPQQMFGAVIKSYFAENIGVAPNKICSISIMPCLAKKSESGLPTMKGEFDVPDVDFALTTREVIKALKMNGITPNNVDEVPFDTLMGDYTGAGVIFGATGGVMEAALRTAHYAITGVNGDPDSFHFVEPEGNSADHPWQETTYKIGDVELKIAVTSGLANAGKLCSALLKGQVKYDFVEIMACPEGCSGGGGQPIHIDDIERGAIRGQVLYSIDKSMNVRNSHENTDVAKLYADYMGAPLSEKAEKLLHTDHEAWKMPADLARETLSK